MIKKIVTIFITIITIQVGFSQTLDTLKLNNYFKSLDLNNKFMGSVGLLKKGKIVYNNQIGFADFESKKKPDENTKYRVGSISKTFTATLIFKAIEEGKISLNQTIYNYFPSIKNSDSITISNLLNHRSGIHNFTNNKRAYLKYNTKPKSEQEVLSIISKFDSDFKPNSKVAYSNSNYVLLSYLLQKIYKKPFDQILKEKIAIPLDLKNTYFGGKIQLEKNESYSYSYSFKGKWKKQTETDTSIPMGAGGIISTPTDLLLFAEAFFTYKIISEKSVTKMKSIEDKFGMGLFKMPFYNKFCFGHNGGIDGFVSIFGYFPEEKAAFAITANGLNYKANNISMALLSGLFNKSFTVPTFTILKLKSKDLKKYLGIYSSTNFPLKIKITKSKNTLIAQATGQPSFSLQATKKDLFKFDQAGIILEFDTEKNQMILNQNGRRYKLSKE